MFNLANAQKEFLLQPLIWCEGFQKCFFFFSQSCFLAAAMFKTKFEQEIRKKRKKIHC